jgi:flagellin-like hook-associated protein FlgL
LNIADAAWGGEGKTVDKFTALTVTGGNVTADVDTGDYIKYDNKYYVAIGDMANGTAFDASKLREMSKVNVAGTDTYFDFDASAIKTSIDAATDAINTLRDYASSFGNNYSIVQTREEFTTNLINVLEEGADKLTLADMNEESANMLALQTRQQLAINSLSLASQAAQSVLKLF